MKVFLSHASTDRQLAKRVSEMLSRNGFQVWDDSELMPGEGWAERLDRALREASAMVILLTPEILSSPYFVHEIEYALTNKSYKNRVIPVVAASSDRLDLTQIPWILRKFQMIHAPNLDEEGLQKISQALEVATDE